MQVKQMGQGDCWDLGSWEELRRRWLEAKELKAEASSTSSSREEEAVQQHRDCEEAEGIGWFFARTPPVFVFSLSGH